MSEAVARIRGSIEIAKPDDVGPPVVRSGCRTYAGLQDRSAALTRCGREVSGRRLLSHTQVQTTARYAHLARDTMKLSAARIGDSIDNDLEVDGEGVRKSAA